MVEDAELDLMPSLAIFYPDTRLRDLPLAARRIDARATAERAEVVRRAALEAANPRLHRRCRLSVERLRIVRVETYATLRREPGFDAPVVAELPLGAWFEVARDPVLHGTPERVAACAAACADTRQGYPFPAPDVAACYLDSTLWFPASFGGQIGFVSGRFLAE